MAYVEPNTQIIQAFINQSANTIVHKLYAVVVGAGYRIDTDEDTAETYDAGAGNTHTYDVSGTTEVVDERETDDDEAVYPITVWIEGAKIARLPENAASGNLGDGQTQITDGTAPFVFTPKDDGTLKFRIADVNGVVYHKVNDILSCVLLGGTQYTITFNNPILCDSDTTAKNFLWATDNQICDIVSIAADKASMVVDTVAYGGGALTGTITLTGNLIYGAPNTSDKSYEYTCTKVNSSTLNVSGWSTEFYFSNVEYVLLEIYDFTLTKTTHWTTSSTILSVKSGLLDASGDSLEDGGSIHVAYRALRTDICDEVKWTDADAPTDSIQADIGSIIYQNTLAYGVYRASQNAGGLKVGYVGVDSTYLTNKSLAFSEAIDILLDTESKDGIYHVVPLSQISSVHLAFDNHVDAASTKERGLWRVCYLNKSVLSQKAKISETTAETQFDGQVAKVFKDTSGSGSFSLAAIDDNLVVTGWTKIFPTKLDEASTADGDDITWDPVAKTLTIVQDLFAGAPPAIFATLTAAEMIGRHLMITTSGAPCLITPTADDTSKYIDNDHPSGTNDQEFKELGYKISNCVVNAGVSTIFTLDAVGSSAILTDTGAGWTVTFEVYDSVLSLAAETALLARENDIKAIVNNAQVALDETLYTWVFAGPITADYTGNYTGMTYVVYGSPSKDEQADNIAAYSSSFANRRVRLIMPDEYKDEAGNTLRGYFIACEVAGWFSGHDPQQGFTNSSVGSGYQLQHSNKYFSRTQLNAIADGAVMILTQSTDGAKAICRHQLTTDDSTVYYKEASIAHCVDTSCYMVKLKFDPFLGKYNMTQMLYDDVATAIEGIKKVLLKPKPRIGGILKKFDLVSIGQNTSEIDECDVVFSPAPNVPLNRFNVTMRIV